MPEFMPILRVPGPLQTMIGPTMTLVLGSILFWVIISVLGPIYDLISEIDF